MATIACATTSCTSRAIRSRSSPSLRRVSSSRASIARAIASRCDRRTSPTASARRQKATLRSTTLTSSPVSSANGSTLTTTHGMTASPASSVWRRSRSIASWTSATIGMSTTVLPGSSAKRTSTTPAVSSGASWKKLHRARRTSGRQPT